MRDDSVDDVCLHVLGRRYRTRPDLAAAFIRRVEAASLRGQTELTPLLHNRGLEMLFVTMSTPMSMHDSRDHSLDSQHRPHGGADARSGWKRPVVPEFEPQKQWSATTEASESPQPAV